jgi:hypothetical protein
MHMHAAKDRLESPKVDSVDVSFCRVVAVIPMAINRNGDFT